MSKISRRQLLKATAVGAVGASIAPIASAQLAKRQKSDRIRFGIIGAGGKGWSGMEAAAAHGDIVAICDIDAETRFKANREHPRASAFDDFRIMIETMAHRMDAVVISTPDHTHAPAAAMAMKAGLHVYCEKPLTRTIWEARQLARIAREKKVMTQMGNQGTATDGLRKAAALLKAGVYGAVKEIHCWTDRAGGWWPQGVERPAPAKCPKHVDFDLWLGPRPERPYAEGYHPFAWRGWWDFGTGSLGDIGCHNMNLPFMAFDLRDPVSVIAETSGHNKDSYPTWAVVQYQFAARGNRPAVGLTWYDGGKKPAPEKAPGHELKGNGCLIICEKMTLVSDIEYGADMRPIDGSPMPDIEFERSPGHMAELAEAIRGGKKPVSNFVDYAGPLTETVLLGNLAIWASGRLLEWDAKRMKVKGTDEFDELIVPTFRPGWSL